MAKGEVEEEGVQWVVGTLSFFFWGGGYKKMLILGFEDNRKMYVASLN